VDGRRVEKQLSIWELRVSGSPFPGGTAALVLPVTRADGTNAVLKLIDPADEQLRHEHAALRAFDGDGAVRLLDAAPDGGALLLERLEPGLPLETHSDRDAVVTIVCGLMRRIWRPAPADHPFPTASELARRWQRELPTGYERAERPFARRLIDAAVSACDELAEPDHEPVIGNRDIHLGNVLSAQREPWLLIDPQPVAAEPAFDVAYLFQDLLTDRPAAAEARTTLDRLAAELDVSGQRVRLWLLVRCVDNALDGVTGDDPWAQRNIAVAQLMTEL
jgi:streptomycin 6-kinase